MKRLITLLSIALIINISYAQKRPLTGDDILKWNRITERMNSDDGKYIIYKTEPWKGDPVLHVSDNKGKELVSFKCGTRAQISPDSRYLVFMVQPGQDTLRQLKLMNNKKDKPANNMLVYNLENGYTDTITKIKSFKMPEDYAFLAWQATREEEKEADKEKEKTEENKGEAQEPEKKNKEDKKEKKESSENGYILYLRDLYTGDIKQFPYVTEYEFAPENDVMFFISTGDEKDFLAGVYRYELESGDYKLLFEGTGDFKQLSPYKDASLIAFLVDTVTREKEDPRKYNLYLWDDKGTARELLNYDSGEIPENWEISGNGRISFSDSGKRLFFGTAPIKPEKDTTILEEELPVIDIWHWKEPVLQSAQINRKRSDENKTYSALYDIPKGDYTQLETEDFTSFNILGKGDSNWALESKSGDYYVETMWEGGRAASDIYLVNLADGTKELLKKEFKSSIRESTSGKYLFWYNEMDTSYYTYKLDTKEEFRITSPDVIQSANELNDVPDIPNGYGSPGWLKDDESILVYDRYDIWKVDPENRAEPVNMTVSGRKNSTSYRLIDFERGRRGRYGSVDDEGIDPEKKQYLSGHNDITREEGYYSWSMKKPQEPKELLYGKFQLGTPVKAKDSDDVMFAKEDFNTFPDILASDLSFKKQVRISEANPQQKEFIWGTAELVSWISLDGRKLEGTLHKPESFDPAKKYPMIVNFYEKSSQGLYDHHIPERGRSTIDYHYYTSNGYLIFNPDVYYKEGYPGEDAFNCVMPGVTALIEKGFVDEKHIGAQGHSWGGYQVAYLATRTNLFAAIESGAPVVNMFSAYGGIRWGSGVNRSFQYEHGQSRIGKSIWESPLRYMENSPIFTIDKIQTPILIMHNDDDGAVPWYQGIEFFIALRRLGKPAWLLNYNDADHWPTRLEDKHDFQIRLAQFFDHYLKGAPMPKWMSEGVPSVKKGVEFGYELSK